MRIDLPLKIQIRLGLKMLPTRAPLGIDTVVKTWRVVVGYDRWPKSLGAKSLAQAIRNGDTIGAYADTAALDAANNCSGPKIKIYMSVQSGDYAGRMVHLHEGIYCIML